MFCWVWVVDREERKANCLLYTTNNSLLGGNQGTGSRKRGVVIIN